MKGTFCGLRIRIRIRYFTGSESTQKDRIRKTKGQGSADGVCILTNGQTDRPTDRQAERQTGRETDRQTGRDTDRQTDRQADRQIDKNSYIDTGLYPFSSTSPAP